MKHAFNAAIDDLDLDPVEFRVYCHILRRGECWESIENAANHCKVSESTYRRALQRLVYRHSLVAFQERRGQTTIYRALENYEQKGRVSLPETPSNSDTPPLVNLTPPPLADLTPKVLPIEVEQRKEDRAAEHPENRDAFTTFESIVRGEVRFLRKRSFDFDLALSIWGEGLPELWRRSLAAPNRKSGDQPIWRFQDACERKLDLGLEPPKCEPPAEPNEPDENGIVLGERCWHNSFGYPVLILSRIDPEFYMADTAEPDSGIFGRTDAVHVEYLEPQHTVSSWVA